MPLSPTLSPLLSAMDGSVRAAFERLAGLRFRHVQLSTTEPGLRPRDLDKTARRDVLATLRRSELTLSGLDAWIPPGHFTDAAQSDRAVSAVQAAIELAADLGRVPLSLIMPADAQIAQAIINHAHRHGVELADHTLPPRPGDGAGIGIDPAACLAQSIDPASIVTAHASKLVAARLCDLLTTGMRGPPGDPPLGRLDVISYQVALSVSGYRRAVIIDARQWTDPRNGIVKAREAWGASN